MDSAGNIEDKDLIIWVPRDDELPEVVDMFVDIFKDDPLYRALFREDEKYLEGLAEYFKLMVKIAHRHHQVFVAGNYVGGAIFFPPGVTHVSIWEQITLFKTACRIFSVRKLIPSLISLNVFEYVKPKQFQYYLFLVGHKPGPALSHRGIATALTNPTFDECDRIQAPCYVEFITSRSQQWGEKRGFKVFKEQKVLFHPEITVKLAIREPAPQIHP